MQEDACSLVRVTWITRGNNKYDNKDENNNRLYYKNI